MAWRVCFILFLWVLSFQACSDGQIAFSPQGFAKTSSGNGEGYDGKLRFEYRDSASVCVEKGANGQPLPNRVIFAYSAQQFQLVRNQCQDIQPVFLTDQDVSQGLDQLTYQNQVYNLVSESKDFDVLAAPCPSNQNLKTGVTRTNLMGDSIDLLSSRWDRHPGIMVQASGSLAGLPLFQISRNDSALLDAWRRLNQYTPVLAGETYVFSAFIRRDASQDALFVFYAEPTADYFSLSVNLITGQATSPSGPGFSNISVATQSLASGVFISVFLTPNNSGNLYPGITPKGQTLGSQIFATALQMEKVADYCGP